LGKILPTQQRGMEPFQIILLASLVILSMFILSDLFAPNLTTSVFEGFATNVPTTFWSSFTAPRTDVDGRKETSAYIRDPRYFNDYADVTRLGSPYDFCRMVAENGEPENLFFACALSGTEGLSSTSFRTPAIKDGFRISYDDYMRDVNGDGRDDYCRILLWNDNSYQPVCAYAGDTGFDSKERIDSNPPDEIKTLLSFYQGASIWFRFNGDILDILGVVKANIAGNMKIDETPRTHVTQGLTFDGSQYLRLSDSSDMALGSLVPLRALKTFMCWVYFDEFTNNAKVFDFGNGAGMDNVFLGIVGKGDSDAQLAPVVNTCIGENESTVPDKPSGAQPVEEMSPQDLMTTTEANVDDVDCHYKITPLEYGRDASLKKMNNDAYTIKTTATLIYEVWDKQDRKMSLKVPTAFALKGWTHVTVTCRNTEPFRPDIAIYINGILASQKKAGWLPSTSKMTNCYLGKSNWSGTQYTNQDELFKGKLFDFRAYKTNVSPEVIKASVAWGKQKLAIK
jgi:hypothetical protein